MIMMFHFTLNLFESFLLALAAVWTIRVRRGCPDQLLLFIVFACGGIAISFEVLSSVQQLQFASIRLAIVASLLVAIVAVRLMRRNVAKDANENDFFVVPETTTTHLLGVSSKDPERLLEAGVSIVLLMVLWATAFIALSCVPNNYDSMSYHLPRIEHWVQNRSLDYYPTSIVSQLDSNPFAEELILALRSIIDAYPLANMIQWLSFAGCIMVIGAICRQLGGARQAQTLAHALGSTLPVAILQASSTQNDLVTAFFCVTCVYFVLRIQQQRIYEYSLPAIVAGVLAFHTKGTAAIFLCGFAMVFGALILRSRPSIVFWRNALIACLLSGGIVGGYFVRNLETFGTPIGPSSNTTMTKEPSWRGATLNAVRDIASNLYFPKSASIRNDIVRFVYWTRKRLGISQAQDDANYTFLSERFGLYYPVHEDSGSNTAHTLIVMSAATVLLFLALSSRKWWHQSGPLRTYLLATLISMLAFFILLRWQPWIVRLELGGFMIIIPPVALLLSELSLLFLIFGIAALSLQSSVFIFNNASRPLFGHRSVVTASAVDVLFDNRPDFKDDYVHLGNLLVRSRPKRVGLVTGGASWEFPIWYLLREKLSEQEMPIIVHETQGINIDLAADFVVYLDTTAPDLAIKSLVRIGGFDKIQVYQNTRAVELR
jgi:hypothetical protein